MRLLPTVLMAALAAGAASGAAAQSSAQRARDNAEAWAVCMWQNFPAEAARMQEDSFWSSPPKSYLTPQGAVDIDKFCRVASPRSTRITDYQRQLRSEGARRASARYAPVRARYVQCMVADERLMADILALGNYAVTDADRAHYRPIIEADLKAFDADRKAKGLPGEPMSNSEVTDPQIAARRYLDQPVPESFKIRAEHCDPEAWRRLSGKGNDAIKAEMLSLLRERDGREP